MEIYDKNKKTMYILNPTTRIFEEKKKEEKNSLDNPHLPEENER